MGSVSQSSRRVMKQGETLSQILLQQGVRTPGQKHGRGRRTLRRRRTEKKVVVETPQDYLDDRDTFKDVEEEPRNSGREEVENFRTRRIVENDDSSNSMEAGDSDDNANEDMYHYEKWDGASYGAIANRSNEMMEMSEEDADEIEEENGYDEEDGQNLEGDMEVNEDDSDRDVGGMRDEASDSSDSGDYSD
ncbi:UNVERIFIED_CONTAM: hypothetical protein Slati_1995400 [Sesamum latifolium]|uniref:Uncharacterized protein n=1 Tax=Sesamum latifolium TaxID=2727402 RepID=A0AAW2WQD0_9LAMI